MHQGRQPIIANGLASGEPQRTAFEASDIVKHRFRGTSAGKNRSRFNEKQSACLSQLDPSSYPVE
jgi:hypothetical protein